MLVMFGGILKLRTKIQSNPSIGYHNNNLSIHIRLNLGMQVINQLKVIRVIDSRNNSIGDHKSL